MLSIEHRRLPAGNAYPAGSLASDVPAVEGVRIERFARLIVPVTRRGFLASLTASALALPFDRPAQAQVPARPPITDILNFLLNFEYLEANFYLFATTGHGLDENSTGGGPVPAEAPTWIDFDAVTFAVIHALAQDETNHVALLRTAITSLGGTPIAQPAIHYGALGRISIQAHFLAVTQQFTALGNSAYAGCARYLAGNPGILTTVAQILGAEGQHAGMVNSLCIAQRVVPHVLDHEAGTPEPESFFTVTPGTGLSPIRTPSEILGVAYGVSTSSTSSPAPGTTLGGFFPLGVNGNIKTT